MAATYAPNTDRQVYALREIILGLVRQEDRDLTALQLAVFLICYHENEPQTVRGLAEKLNVSKSSITRVFDRLEDGGLLRRKIDPLDRRSVFAMSTLTGRAYYRDVKQIVVEAAKAAEAASAAPPE